VSNTKCDEERRTYRIPSLEKKCMSTLGPFVYLEILSN